MENELAEVLLKTTPIYQKPYPEPISKADTKPVTVNIAAINAVGTHFYMQREENKAFLRSTVFYRNKQIKIKTTKTRA
jgi:hypothetical protein